MKDKILGFVAACGPVTLGQIRRELRIQDRPDGLTPLGVYNYECAIPEAISQLIREGEIELYCDMDTEVSFVTCGEN